MTAGPLIRPCVGPALEARSLYRFYRAGEEETLALQGVSLTVAAGETVAITGPSGSGKSTLLGCLSGLDDPDGGTVLVGGERLSHRSALERARLRGTRLGLLFQSGNLVAHLTVAQNVDLAQRIAGKRRDARARTTRSLLDAVELTGRADAWPPQLSGGEAARAGLAVALANEPQVLLADEPTGEVDSRSEAAVLALLHATAARGTAVVLVTHSAAVAAAADRRIALSDGRVVATDGAAEVAA
ncbi:MAG TPA: ABC transporter ATP-binding protein [Frankiaceae bacterium]